MAAYSTSSTYIALDLVDDILLRLPVRSLIRFKSVSRQWKSLIESESFVKRHMKRSRRQILVAMDLGDDSPPFLFPDVDEEEGGEEEICYISNCDASRISLTCDGLICIPGPDSIQVCNPATRESRRFPNGEPLVSTTNTRPPAAGKRPIPIRSIIHRNEIYDVVARFPTTKSTFGFGQDEVTGAYKVVELRASPYYSVIVEDCNVLDLETGLWRYVSLVPYRIFPTERSVYANGSVHWFTVDLWEPNQSRIVAFDLHLEEFRVISHPNPNSSSDDTPYFSELLSLQNRLSLSEMSAISHAHAQLDVWSMVDVQEQIWVKMYKICLCGIYQPRSTSDTQLFTLLAIPEEGRHGVVTVWDYQQTVFKSYSNGYLLHKVSSYAHVLASSYFQTLVRVP